MAYPIDFLEPEETEQPAECEDYMREIIEDYRNGRIENRHFLLCEE